MKESFLKHLESFSKFIFYSLVFFIPLSKAGIEITSGLLLFCFIIKKLFRPDFRFLKSSYHIFLLFFIIFLALSLLNSGLYLKKSLNVFFFKWLQYIGIFLFVQDIITQPKQLRISLVILIVGAGLVGIDSLFQRFTGIDFLRQRRLLSVFNNYAVTGPFHHYNDLGAYLVLVLALVLGAIFLGRFKQRFFLFLLAGILGLSLILTYSRGSWLGFLVSLIFMLILSKRYKPLILILVIFVLSFVLFGSIRQRLFFSFQPGGDAGRFKMWQGAWLMIKENPFLGKGIGTFMEYFPHYTKDLGMQYAHNCFLQLWAETGIFSLISFLGFLGLIIYKAIKVFLKTKDYLILGLVSGIFGFLVHSFFDTQLYSLQLAVLFWTTLGLLVKGISLYKTGG